MLEPSFDSWFFEPLNERERREKRFFETQEELDADVMEYVTEAVADEILYGNVPMIYWLVDVIFGGEDEFKKFLAGRIKKTDEVFKDFADEYREDIDAKIIPGY